MIASTPKTRISSQKPSHDQKARSALSGACCVLSIFADILFHLGAMAMLSPAHPDPHPRPQGCPENVSGLVCLAQNRLEVFMRGLDQRIHAVAGAVSARREGKRWPDQAGLDDSDLRIRIHTHGEFSPKPPAQAEEGRAGGLGGRKRLAHGCFLGPLWV